MIRDFFKTFFSRVDDKILIRTKEDEILRLNNTINVLLEKQSIYHDRHIENSEQTLTERENQLRREFESVLRTKNNEIITIKNKYKNFWEMYEELNIRKIDLEKLKVKLLERIEMASSFTAETTKSLKIAVTEIEDFILNMEKLEIKIDKLIPER